MRHLNVVNTFVGWRKNYVQINNSVRMCLMQIDVWEYLQCKYELKHLELWISKHV